jgi:hypothetical protein
MGENSGGRMSREVRLIPEAVKDYKALDGSIKKLAKEKIWKFTGQLENGFKISTNS